MYKKINAYHNLIQLGTFIYLQILHPYNIHMIRTIGWAVTLKPSGGKHNYLRPELSGLAVMGKFLDDPNLVMLVVNQHHNVRDTLS